MENTPQNKKTLEREIRDLNDLLATKKRLTGIDTIENEIKFKKEQLANLTNA